MNEKADLNNKKITISVVVLAVFIFGIGFWINNLIAEKKQAEIQITPEEVIEAFQNAGYEVSNVVEYEEGHAGPMGKLGYHIICNLQTNNSTYDFLLIQYETWEIARGAARFANKMNKRWNGGYAYAFSYGKVLVMFGPPDEEFGDELLSVLVASH